MENVYKKKYLKYKNKYLEAKNLYKNKFTGGAAGAGISFKVGDRVKYKKTGKEGWITAIKIQNTDYPITVHYDEDNTEAKELRHTNAEKALATARANKASDREITDLNNEVKKAQKDWEAIKDKNYIYNVAMKALEKIEIGYSVDISWQHENFFAKQCPDLNFYFTPANQKLVDDHQIDSKLGSSGTLACWRCAIAAALYRIRDKSINNNTEEEQTDSERNIKKIFRKTPNKALDAFLVLQQLKKKNEFKINIKEWPSIFEKNESLKDISEWARGGEGKKRALICLTGKFAEFLNWVGEKKIPWKPSNPNTKVQYLVEAVNDMEKEGRPYIPIIKHTTWSYPKISGIFSGHWMFIECIFQSDNYNDCGGGIVIIRNSYSGGVEQDQNRFSVKWGYLSKKEAGGGYYVLSFDEFKKFCKNVIGIESQDVSGLRDIYTKEWDEREVENYSSGFRDMTDVLDPLRGL